MSEPEIESIPVGGRPEDSHALIQEVLRESYLQTTADLKLFAEKVRRVNQKKKALRAYLTALRAFKAEVMSEARTRGVSLCRGDKNDQAVLAEVFRAGARDYDVGSVEYELCIPDRVPPAGVASLAMLDAETARLETQLATLGDDAQLANIDLQNVLQKQQQLLHMLSNISKTVHDTSMAIIRKISG